LDEYLIIIGASARAAAGSALRAGLRPWCVDLFGDADLLAMCPARRLEGKYPQAFEAAIASEVRGPWMYTGGLEHHPRLVDRMVRVRPLWGNHGDVLRRARDPVRLTAAAREAGLPAPALGGGEGRWLVKPRRGAGGNGIRLWEGMPISRSCYLQQFIDGDAASVVFAGREMVGMTRQLVGEAWLAAPPFRYCGSVGPVEPMKNVAALGEVLADRLGLRGLYGVDGIVREGEFWPVELNPRYTASVEVLERATGVRALALYSAILGGGSLVLPHFAPGFGAEGNGIVGKAILYARKGVTFPPDGPWSHAPNDFADLPHPYSVIDSGHPILTLFASDADALRRRAAEVEALLYAGP
jgi:uncharacterized protein